MLALAWRPIISKSAAIWEALGSDTEKADPRLSGGNQAAMRRKQTRKEQVRTYIADHYPRGIPAGVTDKDIARATGASERTVRRARQR